ncbi:protein ABHD16A isoform X2 [Cephus cinctus]|uniref:Protein ABHD16A isoform X2 n=1 Tax=Cephus cinctus TaxID=211228 RepID=A0AAJ7RTC4_CEPCN|nr:protein ABHD16A isoform X2 [Cephus cinctus]
MSFIRTLWQCTFSPRLFKIYKISWWGRPVDKPYNPDSLERWGDRIVICFATMWSISIYAIPFVAIFMYQKVYPLSEHWHIHLYSVLKLQAIAGAILIASLIARSYSRAVNPVYLEFINTLNKAKACVSHETRQELHNFDFEFWAWPVDFRVSDVHGLAAYVIAHTFAIKIMYPGCVTLVIWAMHQPLLQGRTNLMKNGGERYKLLTADNNVIDTMFVDKRNKTNCGDVLTITCEGNCGFYEIGIMSTPLAKGHSVLGWNHPGFGGSTGTPYPLQEENAIDCVMQFAINRLGFSEDKIILFGWSIGGYTATWAAMNYPSIQNLVLDATFDDILPLAITKMPARLEGLVRTTVREYLNLNVAEQLNRYNGPVLIVRRTEDEMICTPVPIEGTNEMSECSLSGNRGNHLLIKLLVRRYPHVFRDAAENVKLVLKLLCAQTEQARISIMAEVGASEERFLELVTKHMIKNNWVVSYPSTLGEDCTVAERQQLAIVLALKYLQDHQSTHCTPLPVEYYRPGWNPTKLSILKET